MNECTYRIETEDGATQTTSTVRLLSESGLFGLLVDPIIVQVPDNATVENATVDDGNGPQDLVVTETQSFNVQPGIQTMAEPGQKFWIIDLPPAIESLLPTRPDATDLDYNFEYQIPGPPAGMCCNFQKAASERLVGSIRLRLMHPPRTAC